jgi:hypothetical protein
MQRERVQDSYPWTWEIPAGVACGLGLAVVLGWQVARSVANWLAGAGWVWPAAGQVFGSVPGLLAGDASAGVAVGHHAVTASVLWVAMIAATLLTLAAGVLASLWAWRRWGNGGMRGMASIAEARELLGADRLYRVRHVVRPDLYPAHSRRTR